MVKNLMYRLMNYGMDIQGNSILRNKVKNLQKKKKFLLLSFNKYKRNGNNMSNF